MTKPVIPQLTTHKIIAFYLTEFVKNAELTGNNIISSVTIETDIQRYAINNFSVFRLPTTYSRAFREIREKNLFPKFKITELENPDIKSKVKYFKIERAKEN